jgi:hypothetical protein
MNLTTALRLAIVVYLLTLLFVIAYPLPSRPLLQEYLVWSEQQNPFSFLDNVPLYLAVAFFGFIFALIIAPLIGLFLGNHWAKPAYIAVLIIGNVLWFFFPEPTVESSVVTFITYIAVMAEGFILALLLFTEVPLDKPNKWLSIIGFTVLYIVLLASSFYVVDKYSKTTSYYKTGEVKEVQEYVDGKD